MFEQVHNKNNVSCMRGFLCGCVCVGGWVLNTKLGSCRLDWLRPQYQPPPSSNIPNNLDVVAPYVLISVSSLTKMPGCESSLRVCMCAHPEWNRVHSSKTSSSNDLACGGQVLRDNETELVPKCDLCIR